MDELWVFVVLNNGMTWTRAQVPAGIRTVRDMLGYLHRGGNLAPISDGLSYFPERARFTAKVIGMTVLAQVLR